MTVGLRLPILLSALLLSLWTTLAAAPNVRFRHFSVENGLSENWVEAIIQDRRGFLWLGTRDGLNRFDGYKFLVYNHVPDDPATISNNSVRDILEAQNGDLWIGTRWGLNRFDPTTERFTRYLHDPADPRSLSDNFVYHIEEDSKGRLWIATHEGLNRLDPVTGVFSRFRRDPNDPNSLGDNRVETVYEDRSGDLWIGTAQGLDRFNPDTGEFRHFLPDSCGPKGQVNPSVHSIYEDRGGLLWIGTREGLLRLDLSSGRFLHHCDTVFGAVSDVREDSEGRLWVGAASGLWRLGRDRSEFEHYAQNRLDPSALSSNGVSSVFVDSFGGLWVGTTGSGVNAWSRFRYKFELYESDPTNSNSLGPVSVRAIYEDPDQILWIGGHTGLDSYDYQADTFTHYVSTEDSNGPSSSNVNVIYADPVDHRVLWIGTEGGGINRLDRTAGTFDQLEWTRDGSAGLTGRNVYSVLEDQAGYLWIGTELGLNRFDKTTKEFHLYRHDPGDASSLSDGIVTSIYMDGRGALWIGTEEGLNQFDTRTETFVRYLHRVDDPASLGSSSILVITEDRNGELWIGTRGGGLNRLDRDSGTFFRYTKTDGLPNNVVHGILEDGEGALWLSTNRGISRFDLESRFFRNYEVTDGLQSKEFNSGAYHKGRSGELFFGGIRGLNRFDPHVVDDDPNFPILVITDLQLFNRSVPIGEYEPGRAILESSITETEAVELNHGENVLSLEFAALQYTASERNLYAYMLEGLDEGWNYVGNRRFAIYTGLRPGKYVFKVKGSNSDGVWNEEGTSLAITITPAFYSTWWFRQLAIAAVVLSALGAYKVKTLTYRRRNQVLVRLNEQLEAQVAERRKTESRLRRSEEKFRDIFEHSRDGLFVTDIEGNILTANQAALDLLGYAQEDMAELNIRRIYFDRDGRDRFEEAIEEQGYLAGYEVSLKTKDDRKVECSISATFRRAPDGSVGGYQAIVHDITQRKRTERIQAVLLEINERASSFGGLEELLDSVRKSLHKIIDCSNFFLALHDEEKDKYSFPYVVDVDEDPENLSPQQLRRSLTAYVRRTGQPLLADQETRKRLIEQGEVEVVGRPSACWLGAPLKTPERVIGIVSVQTYDPNSAYSEEDLRILSLAADGITRIIERRLAEGALRASEKLYRGLIEDQTELVFRWSPDGTRTFINDACCEFFGRSRVELLGTSVFLTISEQGREAFRTKIESLTPDHPAATAEHPVLARERRTSWIEWTDRAVFDAGGQLLGYQSVGRDVTDRRRLEEQFHQAQKMEAVGVLAGGVAHDFNNLLTGMIGYTSLLLKKWSSDEATTADLKQIRNLANRGAGLTRQLLAFSRQQPLAPTVVRLNDLIQNILSMLGRLIGEDIELTYECEADPDSIRADHSQIEQVLMNLAVNAREAMPHGGSLAIRTANADLSEDFANSHPEISPGGYVVLTVSDSGEGMDEPTLQHVFEPFFTTKALGKGTGLGLSTAYGIVREHKGHIEVKSAPGEGARFEVYLPATTEETAEQPVEPELVREGRGEAVLVVDDDDSVARVVERELEDSGYTVFRAQAPAEAEEIFSREGGRISLLVTDIVMPGASGAELFERLAARNPGLKVLFMTGHVDGLLLSSEVIGEGLTYMQKPFPPEAVAEKARQLLDSP